MQIVDGAGGPIDNVVLKNISWESADHPINLLAYSQSIRNVTFQNCTRGGKKVIAADVTVSGTVTGVSYQ